MLDVYIHIYLSVYQFFSFIFTNGTSLKNDCPCKSILDNELISKLSNHVSTV